MLGTVGSLALEASKKYLNSLSKMQTTRFVIKTTRHFKSLTLPLYRRSPPVVLYRIAAVLSLYDEHHNNILLNSALTRGQQTTLIEKIWKM